MTMKRKKQVNSLWTAEDERVHSSSTLEWWAVIGFFTSKENQKHWSIKATLSEGVIDPAHYGSVCNIAVFDEDTKHQYVYVNRKLDSPLNSRQDVFEVNFDDSSMNGAYPFYEVRLQDPVNDIEIDITLHAESLPYQVGQEATDGWLPMGLGIFRYGFIPKMRISGTMKIQGTYVTIEGTGYFEHIWGNISFRNPVVPRKNLMKTISIYTRLLVWWLQHQKPSLPSSLMWSTENNPLGYDWAWALLDNGWMLFYGNVLSWIMEGPATGVLILSKDGKTFTEFGAITFRYIKTKFAHHYDFLYPTELEITALHEHETLHLRFTMTEECREYISQFSNRKYWLGFVTCEAPGTVMGYYMNEKEKIPLSGKCKIEPQRQVSIIGHNSLRIDLLKPPRGIGISLEIDSHYLKKKVTVHLQLVPQLTLRFNCKRIEASREAMRKTRN